MKIFSVDAETDGLYGPAFAIAVTVRENGKEIARFEGRIPNTEVTDVWVWANIIPVLGGMKVTHSSSEKLEEAFWAFWELQRENAVVVAYCGSPVESGLFRRCVERRRDERQWSGPFPAINDVATLLLVLGEDESMDAYNKKCGIVVPFEGEAHHPMYDAVAAAVCWEYAFSKLCGPRCACG